MKLFVRFLWWLGNALGFDVPLGSWLGRQYIGAMFRRVK